MTPQLSANPPTTRPPLTLDLVDGDRAVGWVHGDVVGFRGFADESEAAHAAWVAYRTLLRRLARSNGVRPAPIGIEPLALARHGDEERILASGHPIARLVRPRHEDGDSVGFEITVPAPADEIRVRAMGHLIYRTLRKSGLRWAMWTPAPEPLAATATEASAHRAADGAPVTANPNDGGESNVAAHRGRTPWRVRLLPSRDPRRAGGWWGDLLVGVRQR